MPKSAKILLALILCTAVLTQEKICKHLGFGRSVVHQLPTNLNELKNSQIEEAQLEDDDSSNEPVYNYDNQSLGWKIEKDTQESYAQLVSNEKTNNVSAGEIVEISWEMLMNIEYRLRYFDDLEMEVYVPVFGDDHKALDGKEVTITGYVIPFDLDGQFLSLSANPYASCFFCGQASPASVISLYLKNDKKRYKVDDFRRFKGTLHLNYDDPNEFYYILRDAREV
ncbi:MAG: hypothetical protein AAF741_17700 [Bacteroidota bacterium]